MKLKFLDLFCCCGGISQGVKNICPEAEITGVDLKDNHQYPFNFINKDVFELDMDFLKSFDLIHASPPCQFYIPVNKWRNNDYPDLIDKTRQLLLQTGKPFTLENVQGSPLRKDLVLCGEMFGLRVIRHRIFEIHNFSNKAIQPKHVKHRPPLDKTHSYYACVAGHGGNGYSFKLEDWQKAMGIDWVSKKEHLTQMIPPVYYEHIVNEFLHGGQSVLYRKNQRRSEKDTHTCEQKKCYI